MANFKCRLILLVLMTWAVPSIVLADKGPEAIGKRVLFGDLHVHTGWSLDAFAFGVIATPDDAFRFARGEAIRHALGYEFSLRAPLDFIAVTDHAEYLGVFAAMAPETGAIETCEARSCKAHTTSAESVSARSRPCITTAPSRPALNAA